MFEARTIVEVCGLHLHAQPVPPSERLGRPLPEGLERAILRGLAKKPDDRFSSAEAFARELRLASGRGELDARGGASVVGEPRSARFWKRNAG